MNRSSFVELFSNLSNEESHSFSAFVCSDYWNKDKNVRLLIEILLKVSNLNDSQQIQRKTLWLKLFPDFPYNYAKLRMLFSKSLSLLERFIAISNIQGDGFALDTRLLDELSERDHPTRFNKKRKQLEHQLDSELKKDSSYFHNRTHFCSILDRYYTSKNDYSQRELLEERAMHLDIYYYIEKLSTCCELLNRSLFFKDDYDHPEMDLLEKHLESDSSLLESSSVLKIYYWIYLTLNSPEKEDIYFQLKEVLKSSASLFSLNEYKDVHLYLLNYVSRRINSGKKEFLKESFDLLKLMMEGGMLIRNGKLDEAHYKNFITTSIRNNEFDYLEYFIENYTQYLSDSVRENAYSYNMANLFYAKGDYEKAQALLLQVEYSDINYNLDSKTLLLRIYFDADEDQALYAHINTVKIYLLRNKLINNNKYRRYHQLFRFTKALYKIKENIAYESKNKTAEKLQKLDEQIQKVKAIANRQWLLKKLNELKKECVYD